MSGEEWRAAAGAADERRAAAKAFLAESVTGLCHVKLCGMFRDEDVDAVEVVHPDLCGFVVDFPKSHRSVTPERLSALCARMDTAEAACPDEPHVWRVGVFVDEPPAEVARIVRECGLDVAQLHGHEDAAYVRELRREAPELGLIQAFRVADESDVARACASEADMVLLDNGQGTGERFDWSLTALATRPFMLAGGLSPDNVAMAVEQVHPWGVDMSSGIETARLKDPAKMEAALTAVRGVKL